MRAQSIHAVEPPEDIDEADEDEAKENFVSNLRQLKNTIAAHQSGRNSFDKTLESSGGWQLELLIDQLVDFALANLPACIDLKTHEAILSNEEVAAMLQTKDPKLYKQMEESFLEEDSHIMDQCLIIAWKIRELHTISDGIEMVHVPSLEAGSTLVECILNADEMDLSSFLKGYVLEQADAKAKGSMSTEKIRCAGCGNTVKDMQSMICYEAPQASDTPYYFHDEECVTLRKFKEEIRKFAIRVEDGIEEDFGDISDYILHLIRKKQSLIAMDGSKIRRPNQPTGADILGALTVKVGVFSVGDQSMDQDLIDPSFRLKRQQAFRLANGGEDGATKSDLLNIPYDLRLINEELYGKSLWQFCMDNLLVKNDRKALWRYLQFLAVDLPTTSVIDLFGSSEANLSKLRLEFIRELCTATIEGSKFPMATALSLADFLRLHSFADLARQEEFLGLAEMCISIAFGLLDQIESDHLLAILLETPTDLNNESTFDIAIKYKARRFLNHARIGAISSRMWANYRFLEPSAQFKQQSLTYLEVYSLLYREPLGFYFSPIGKFYVNLVTYLVYVAMVTYTAYPNPRYPFDPLRAGEIYMWIASIGFIIFEIQGFLRSGTSYFRTFSNQVSFTIAMIWLMCAYIRFFGVWTFGEEKIKVKNKDGTLNASASRNLTWNEAYMFLFGFQLVLIWSRILVLFERSPAIGPLLQMIKQMAVDVLKFLTVTIIIFFGFLFSMFYVFADDPAGIQTFGNTFTFAFQVLLSQQNWPITENSRIRQGRADVANLFVVGWTLLGSILLLNLLIALLASSYANVQNAASLEVNFSKFTSTYTFTHRATTMSPPFNLVVLVAWGSVYVLDRIVFILCCTSKVLRPPNLEPITYKRKSVDEEHEEELVVALPGGIKLNSSKSVCCGIVDRSECELKIENPNWVSTCQKILCCGLPTYACVPLGSGKTYCRFCRQQIVKSATIHEYTDLFSSSFDEGDVALLDRLLTGRGLCCYCFRPYSLANGTNRITLFDVMDTALSYYVYIPMRWVLLIVLAPFAFVSRMLIDEIVPEDTSEERAAIQGDETYRTHIREVIDRASQNNRDMQDDLNDIEDSLKELKERLMQTGIQKLHAEFNSIRGVVGGLQSEVRNDAVGNILDALQFDDSDDE